MNKDAIKSALAAMGTDDLLEKSKDLLATLGYQSERTLALSGSVEDFIQEFEALTPNTKTDEENTPIEQEVVLDPELLGRVFENLLAAYNPETGQRCESRLALTTRHARL